MDSDVHIMNLIWSTESTLCNGHCFPWYLLNQSLLWFSYCIKLRNSCGKSNSVLKSFTADFFTYVTWLLMLSMW